MKPPNILIRRAVGICLLFAVAIAPSASAQVVKSNSAVSLKDALKEMLQANGAKSLKKLTVAASDAEAADIVQTRGVTLEGAFTVYNGLDETGSVIGTVVQVNEEGKEGPLQVLVAFEPSGAIFDIGFTVFGEDRGKPALSYPFLKQFIGKSGEQDMVIGRGIDAISGATWTSNSVNSAIRKAVVVFDVFIKDTLG